MKLDPETACTYQPGNHINFARIKTLAKFLKRVLPNNYKGLKGRTFYFQFDSGQTRDAFLADLEKLINGTGNETQRTKTTPTPA